MLAEGLVALLASSDPVVSLVGTPLARQEKDQQGRETNGIFPVQLPEGTPLPAIAYSGIHEANEMTLDGPDSFTVARMQFSCFGVSYGDAKKLARAVRQVLETFTGPLADGTVIDSMHRVSETDGFENEPFSYVSHLDLEIAFNEQGTT